MTEDQTINLNHNSAECIKSASHFGMETYYNICSHTQTDVPWGGADWVIWFSGFSILVAVVLFIMFVAILAVRD